jgi:hypothetical protein
MAPTRRNSGLSRSRWPLQPPSRPGADTTRRRKNPGPMSYIRSGASSLFCGNSLSDGPSFADAPDRFGSRFSVCGFRCRGSDRSSLSGALDRRAGRRLAWRGPPRSESARCESRRTWGRVPMEGARCRLCPRNIGADFDNATRCHGMSHFRADFVMRHADTIWDRRDRPPRARESSRDPTRGTCRRRTTDVVPHHTLVDSSVGMPAPPKSAISCHFPGPRRRPGRRSGLGKPLPHHHIGSRPLSGGWFASSRHRMIGWDEIGKVCKTKPTAT